MSLSNLPNEILAKILRYLPTTDIISCLYLDENIREIVKGHFGVGGARFEIYDGTEIKSTLENPVRAQFANGILVISTLTSTDIYECSDHNPRFYRTLNCSAWSLRIGANQWRMIPDSATVVYIEAMKSRSRNFHVFDLAKSLHLFEAQLPGEPIAIRCSRKSFAFVVRTELIFFRTFIYSWDGISATLARTLPQHRDSVAMTYPQLSPNGVLAYRPGYEERVDFYDTHADIDLGHIEIGFIFEDIELNSDGSLLLVSKGHGVHLALYSITNKTRLFKIDQNEPSLYRPVAFTDDFKLIVFNRLGGCNQGVHLKEDKNGRLVLSHISDLDAIRGSWNAMFRKIGGEQRLLLLEGNGTVCKCLKYSEKKWKWFLQ